MELDKIPDVVYIPRTRCVGLYILSVSMHPGTLKIGWTRDINRRMWDYDTYAPEHKWYSHVILFEFRDCTSTDSDTFHTAQNDEHTFIETELERACLHALQAFHNKKMGTEWFEISVEDAVATLNRTVDDVLNTCFEDLPDIRPVTYEMSNFRTCRGSPVYSKIVHKKQKKWFEVWKADVKKGGGNSNNKKNTNTKRTTHEEKTTTWHERDYQTEIIRYCSSQLQSQKRLFLELATGAGKSYIMYNIFRKVDVNHILIFSPRKRINTQNVSKKYLQLLHPDKLYEVINFSNAYQPNSVCSSYVMVACPQSPHTLQKVKDFIQDNQLCNIFIWFDEGHHTVESWEVSNDSKKQFFMYDKTFQYHMFTSASPDVNVVKQHPRKFGELYSPISVSTLIAQKWLCPIRPHIFKADKNNVSICKYNLEHFTKYKRQYGLSFHHTRNNAKELFLQHAQAFRKQDTRIKPFLLLGEDFKAHTHDELKKMETLLSYNCFDIDTFEISPESIGYVCQKYSMGYDFAKIDYLLLCDPKTEVKDVKQCIGRGTRPDKLGPFGTNKDKTLYVMIPAFIDGADDKNKFYCIRQVLRYLIYDLEMAFHDIVDRPTETSYTGVTDDCSKEYNGKESIEAILLNLLQDDESTSWTQHRLTRTLQKHNVRSPTMYNELRDTRPELFLPADPFVACKKMFYWELTYEHSPFYTQRECIKQVQGICDTHDLDLDNMDTEDVVRTLHGIDSRIPNMALERFYGIQMY